jgi:hypothetical protein
MLYRVTVIRRKLTEVVYETEVRRVEATTPQEARTKVQATVDRLPGVQDEGWVEGEPVTTWGPPEVAEVWTDDGDVLQSVLQDMRQRGELR